MDVCVCSCSCLHCHLQSSAGQPAINADIWLLVARTQFPYIAETNTASAQLAQPSAVASKKSNAEPATAQQRQKSPELQRRYHNPEPQGMDGGLPEAHPAQGADNGKKKKRLTKAADMDKPHQGSDINKPSGAGVKRKMQVQRHFPMPYSIHCCI